MNRIIGQKIYETVVEEGLQMYKEFYEATNNCQIEQSDKNIKFYKMLSNEDKEVFYNIIENTIIDTVSHVLGILDGSSSLAEGGIFEFEIKLDGIDTNQGLQDGFLEVVEENTIK